VTSGVACAVLPWWLGTTDLPGVLLVPSNAASAAGAWVGILAVGLGKSSCLSSVPSIHVRMRAADSFSSAPAFTIPLYHFTSLCCQEVWKKGFEYGKGQRANHPSASPESKVRRFEHAATLQLHDLSDHGKRRVECTLSAGLRLSETDALEFKAARDASG
jgi:hypothetical protein